MTQKALISIFCFFLFILVISYSSHSSYAGTCKTDTNIKDGICTEWPALDGGTSQCLTPTGAQVADCDKCASHPRPYNCDDETIS